jgi:hypothetical protein
VPRSVQVGIGALATSGILLVASALYRIFAHQESVVADLAAVLGVAQLVVVGRVVARHQGARVVAISLALLQALGGVVILVHRSAYGLIALALAGFVVLPLARQDADEYFEPVA